MRMIWSINLGVFGSDMNRMSVKIRLASIGVFLAVLAFQPEESFSQANQGKLVQTVPVYEAMLTFPSPS